MTVQLPNGQVATFCGISNCFRPAAGRRGFFPRCAVHMVKPKWPKDGSFTGSVWVRNNLEVRDGR